MRETTYNVRVFALEERRNKAGKVTSYRVEWRTGQERWKESFKGLAQADAFRSALVTAARNGEPFSLATGKPVSWQRNDMVDMSWYDFACRYVDMKWKPAAARYREDIARALTAATPAMLASQRGKPDDVKLRAAMQRWGFNAKNRDNAPDDVAAILRWLSENTKPVSALADPETARALLNAATSRLNGKKAAATTARKHRMLLANAMDYAAELKLVEGNPIRELKWKPSRTTGEVDRRRVINHAQARALLNAVRGQEPSGTRLVAFFAVMYYAALRPEEAVNLRRQDITLPPLVKNEATGEFEEPANAWGEIVVRKAAPFAGRDWTDDGALREERSLKHRAEDETRPVPCPPALTRILRAHLAEFTEGAGGRVFYGVRGGDLPNITYRRAWRKARNDALTADQFASPLAERPYDLRHACVSTWLNAGVPATQVAEWAGHSVEVLLKIYAKCIAGQDEAARRRIAQALGDS
ncbi:tyrosine-type recombinase/integrase [Actinomadura madurae]|uniref:tyrosine-type recombinase/integrase n=1 Tax=Actinomadura madurae TaxID=1993 RepID=UPI000D8E83F1|nr:tyrosine-type recombinase/integrase [Actinomadura madurae]SPT59243.1 site-specific tyrosine recombinase XerC [Actinomadura madurae]